MRLVIRELVGLGPLPNEEEADLERVERYEQLLQQISPPVTDEEAKALVHLFGPDDCYGLAWTLLHLIETAPHWRADECLEDEENEWIRLLRVREVNRRK